MVSPAAKAVLCWMVGSARAASFFPAFWVGFSVFWVGFGVLLCFLAGFENWGLLFRRIGLVFLFLGGFRGSFGGVFGEFFGLEVGRFG